MVKVIGYLIDGLKVFYKTYGKLIYTVATLFCKQKSDVDDVVNDVLLKVWKFSFKEEVVDNPEGWLYTITKNCARDTNKKVIDYVNLESEEIATTCELYCSNGGFYQLIDRLSEEEQYVLTLKFVSKYSFKEIAQILGKQISTVSSIYYRAIEKIKNDLK